MERRDESRVECLAFLTKAITGGKNRVLNSRSGATAVGHVLSCARCLSVLISAGLSASLSVGDSALEPCVVHFPAPIFSVREDQGTVEVPVTRTGNVQASATVDYATSDLLWNNGAKAGEDYVAREGTLSFAAGVTAQVITVAILNDGRRERVGEVLSSEYFKVALSNPSAGAALGSLSMATISIEDNDQGPVFGDRVYRVNEDAGVLEVPILRGNDVDFPAMKVDLTVTEVSARAGEDFVMTGQSVEIAEGAASALLRIAILDDAWREGMQTFVIELPLVSTGLSKTTIEIHDNDGPVTVVARPWRIPSFGSLEAIAISPDDRFLLTGGNLGVFLWDLSSGQYLRSYSGFDGFVDALAFSPDGKLVLAGGADVFVEGFPRPIPGGGFQTVSDWRAVTRLWESESGKLLRTFEGAGYVGFSRDGRMVLTTDGRPYADFFGGILCDGQNLCSGRGENYRLWDVATGKLRHEFHGDAPPEDRTSQGMRNLHKCVPFAFSSDGTTFLAIGTNGPSGTALRLWDLRTGQGRTNWLRPPTGSLFFAGFTPDASQVMTATADPPAICWWDAWTGVLLRSVPASFRDYHPAQGAMAISPDGSRLLRVGNDGLTVELLDAETGKLLKECQGHGEVHLIGPQQIQTLAFLSDGIAAVSAAGDQTVRLWDTASGQEKRVFSAHSRWTGSFAFSEDGERASIAVAGNWSKALRQVWDIRTGALLSTSGEEDRGGPWAFGGSSDGVRVLARSADGGWNLEVGESVWLREVATGIVRRVFDHGPENRIAIETDEVYGCFSPDGSLVATWLGYHAVRRYPRVWDISDLTARIFVQREGGGLKLSWPFGQLQIAAQVDGPWTTIADAKSPHLVQATGQRNFYRTRKE